MKSPILNLMLWLCASIALPLPAQVQQSWIARHTLSLTGTNQAVAMALDRDGNILIGGHGMSTNGDFDYVALKYAPGGSLLWQANYSGTGDDRVRSMKVDGEGNALLTGTSISVKWNTNGVEQWTAPYGGRGIAVDPSGDAYVTGFSETSYSTVKLHREVGTNMWLRTANVIPGEPDISHVIAVDSKSNVFVSGQVICYRDPRTAYANWRTVSYDADGGLRWEVPVVGPYCYYTSVRLVGIAVDAQGGVYEVAEMSPGANPLIKYSASGVPEWDAYGSYVNGGLRAMVLGNDGSVYLTGKSFNLDIFAATIRIDKISSSGTNAWVAEFSGATARGGNAVAVDRASNVYVAGQVQEPGSGEDWVIIKYSPAGQELWVQRYDGLAHGDDVATAIAVAPDGSVYVTGWSTTSSNLIEITTIKYAQSAAITMETNRTVSLQFPGTPGVSNRVQATTDFLGWLDLGFTVADTNGLIRFVDTNAPAHPFRFYRTVTP